MKSSTSPASSQNYFMAPWTTGPTTSVKPEGLPMGSLISSILIEIFIHHIQTKIPRPNNRKICPNNHTQSKDEWKANLRNALVIHIIGWELTVEIYNAIFSL